MSAKTTGTTQQGGLYAPRSRASEDNTDLLGPEAVESPLATGGPWARAETKILPVVGVLVLLAVWQGVASVLGPYKLPALSSLWPQVITDLWKNRVLEAQGGGSHGLAPDILYTTESTLSGGALGVLLGLFVGLAIGRSYIVRGWLDWPIQLTRTIPPIAIIPFLVIWFGPTRIAQIGVVFFSTAVVLVVTTTSAIRNVDPIYSRRARTLGASDNRIFSTIILPAIVPEVLAGIRVAIGLAWGVEVVSEYAGAPAGMGTVFEKMIPYEALSVIIIGIFWVTVMAVIVDMLIVLTRQRLTRWLPRAAR